MYRGGSSACCSAAWGVQEWWWWGWWGLPLPALTAKMHCICLVQMSRLPSPNTGVTGVWHLRCILLHSYPKLPLCCSPRELDGGRAQEKSKVSAARYEVTGSRPIRRREILGRPMGGPGLPAERPDVKRRGRRSSTGSPVVPQ